MVTITVFTNSQDEYIGFQTGGHAEYADAGTDIVCAAISVLTINAVNSIETLTDCLFTYEENQEGGYMKFMLSSQSSNDAKLLLSSMVLGLKGIQTNYGTSYLSLKFKEV